MKKLIFCISLVCVGLLSSCVDKNELVDEENVPDWLGSSIYGALSNPDPATGLQGTFTNYLRLIDDLGYAETLNRTGSKTVFPANDEAFERFYKSNDWGVTKYEDFTEAQKKMLLYSSMLDNAILINGLSNVSSNSGIVRGSAIKHPTSISPIDSITRYSFASAIAAYGERNPFWTSHTRGINVVADGTTPMLVHFTPNYLLKNNITTSDFAIVTGNAEEEVGENDAYVYGNKIVAPDVTCQNGYIHQVADLMTPPGNMAQVIKRDPKLSLFSHVLDRFAMPVYNNSITTQYADWYAEQSLVQSDMSAYPAPDSIFEVRYLSKSSQAASKFSGNASSGGVYADDYLLTYDPGWNEYYIAALQAGASAPELAEIAAMFVPTNEAMVDYFVNNPNTKLLLDTYGSLDNTADNLYRNLEDVPLNILSKFVSNVMNTSFASSVPSKFSSVVDDAHDVMGLAPEYIEDKPESEGGGKDITVANNGVVYVMKEVFGPKAYEVVSAPALFNSSNRELNTGMVNWIIQNVTYNNAYGLGLDYYAYLLSSASRYGLFLPTKEAFDFMLYDPTSAGRGVKEYIHYYIDNSVAMSQGGAGIGASRWRDNGSGVLDSVGVFSLTAAGSATYMPIVKAQLSELIQMCTVELGANEEGSADNQNIKGGRYYKTKNGAGIYVTGSGDIGVGTQILGGRQLVEGQTDSRVQNPTITRVFAGQSNGISYAIDHLIESTTRSVYAFLRDTPRFSKFYDLCRLFDNQIAAWSGISTTEDPTTHLVEADQYLTFFVPGTGSANTDDQLRCLDYNVKFFNNYNYTLYAPNNDAVDVAIAHGLPTWDDIRAVYDEANNSGLSGADLNAAKAQVKGMIKAIRDFVRYHFHNNSIYASVPLDNASSSGEYSTFLVDDETQINRTLDVEVDGNGRIHVTDAAGEKVIDPSNSSLLSNQMTRDMEFNANRNNDNNYVTASSYAVVHEISQPLSYYSNMDYSQGLVAGE